MSWCCAHLSSTLSCDSRPLTVFKIRCETCRTEAHGKEGKLARLTKVFWSGSVVWHLFWRLLWLGFPKIWEWFRMFLWSYHRKKHYGRNKIDHGRTCGTEFTLMSLYSTEITSYHSWFLERKLTQVNCFPHRHSWWIFYFLNMEAFYACSVTCLCWLFCAQHNVEMIIKLSFFSLLSDLQVVIKLQEMKSW